MTKIGLLLVYCNCRRNVQYSRAGTFLFEWLCNLNQIYFLFKISWICKNFCQSTVRQAYFALHKTSSKFPKKKKKKKKLILRFSLKFFFSHFRKIEGYTPSGRHTNETLNLLTKLWSFKVFLNVVLGSFIASLCSSRWSDQECCKTECVALKTSFLTRPMWALKTYFLARYRFLKWGSKFFLFLQNFENLQRFFTGELWPWRPWTWCPQGGFRG